jgi:transposase
MNRSRNTSFAARLSAAADAKKAQLERAARAKSAAESPAAVERRTARRAVEAAITRIALAFEAGRDGFWLARWLEARGVEAHVIDASSIAVSCCWPSRSSSCAAQTAQG